MLSDFLKDYLPIIIFLIIALGLSCAFVVINFILSPKHPDPEKSGSHALQHSFVESPTAGDNIYTFVVSASADNQTVVTDLPSYWKFLNENPRMWIQPKGMFAQAYGEVSSSLKQFSVTMEKAGSYDVLLIGTRKDIVATSHWNEIGGVESLISGSKFENGIPGDAVLSSSLGL